jgi:predicted GNAT superfamily acetyltransferase
MNAHFNIRKLGAIARHYEENVYGFSRSPLHQGLPTDRLVAEWRLNDDRSSSITSRDLGTIKRIAGADSEPDLVLKESPLLLEIPADINALRQRDLAGARGWQARIRTAFLHYFHEGYAVAGFIREEVPKPQAFYVLEKPVD